MILFWGYAHSCCIHLMLGINSDSQGRVLLQSGPRKPYFCDYNLFLNFFFIILYTIETKHLQDTTLGRSNFRFSS